MVHLLLKLDPLLMTIFLSVFFNRLVELPVKEVDTSTNSPLDPIPSSSITINSPLDPIPGSITINSPLDLIPSTTTTIPPMLSMFAIL